MSDVTVTGPAAEALIDRHGVGGAVTSLGLRANISVGVRYVQSWLADDFATFLTLPAYDLID